MGNLRTSADQGNRKSGNKKRLRIPTLFMRLHKRFHIRYGINLFHRGVTIHFPLSIVSGDKLIKIDYVISSPFYTFVCFYVTHNI